MKGKDILPADKLEIVKQKLDSIDQTVTDLKAKLKESTLDSLQHIYIRRSKALFSSLSKDSPVDIV